MYGFPGRLGKSRAATDDVSGSSRTDAVRLLVDRIDVEAFRAFAQLRLGLETGRAIATLSDSVADHVVRTLRSPEARRL
jgi:hypothetical protein